MGNINIGGLVSGIDTDSIITGMLKIQQQQIDQFNSKKTTIQTKQTAYQSLQTQLVSLRTTAISLASSAGNPFDARIVTVSNPDAIVATASAKAASGTYQIKVNSLATAQQVASQEFADPDSAITEGTFNIRIGSQSLAAITIDATNNTLSGLADAINSAGTGVNASVVQDSTSSYRLLLTSGKTGTANQISITNELADSAGNALKPVFDFDHPVQAASDASVTLGSGTGALTVTSSTNTVSTLITGVSLNLVDADPSKTISITVAADTDKATKAVSDFVDAYNGILDFIDSQTKYDPASDTAAILQGDYSAINVRSQLQNVLQSVIPGGSNKANRLSALGIVTADNGRLTVNTTQLQTAINGGIPGVNTNDLRHLFALDGTGNNGGITFLYAGSKTKESATPYQVNITKAAERATVSGVQEVSENTVIDDTNDSLRINLDGVETTVSLAHGTYTRDQLAQQVEDVVNGSNDIAGRSVSVGLDASNQLTLTSDSYGSSSRVTVYASSAASSLGLREGSSDIGADVAGNFVVNGVVEPATGAGRTLTGNEGNHNTDGLQVKVTLAPSQVTADSEGTVTITRGVASRLNALIDSMLDPKKGILTSLNNSLQDQLDSIATSLTNQQAAFDKQKDELTSRFADMESSLQKLQNTSSLLGSQLQSIKNLGTGG